MEVSQAVAQKLNGTLKKFTVAVFLADGRSIEVQTDDPARIDFDDKARDVFLGFGYGDENKVKMSCVAGWTTTINTQHEVAAPTT